MSAFHAERIGSNPMLRSNFMFTQIVAAILSSTALLDGLSTVNFLNRGFVEQNSLFGSTPGKLRIFGEGGAIIATEIVLAAVISHWSPVVGQSIVGSLLLAQAAFHVDRTIHNFRLKKD
jgi:hypothetical protein